MIAGSLRWRLLLAAAAAILLALAVAWVFMTLLFEWHLLRRLESEMTRDGARLAAALSIGADGAPRVAQAPADSRLDTPAGGYYWQASSPGGVVRSRSLWDAELARVEDAPLDQWRRRQASGPFGQSLVVVERRIRPDAGGAAVLVQLAQDDAPVRAARAEFGRELAAFLLLLWLVLLGAAWLQVRLGLAPLARVGRDLAALRDNAVARLPDPPLREIQPLADAINALADARGEELARARRRAAGTDFLQRMLHGHPAAGIRELAEEMRPDLIVMGKHGQTEIEELLLGSVTKHVLFETHCDMLVATER